MIQFAAMLLLTFVSAYVAGQIAAHKGRSVRAWLWWGAGFGPFATAAVAILPRKRKATTA